MASNVVVSASPPGGFRVGRGAGFRKVRLGCWNIGSLTGKSVELVKSLRRREISIACVQETKWVGAKVREIDGSSFGTRGQPRQRMELASWL